MKILKKIMTCIISGFLAVGLCACGGPTPEEEVKKVTSSFMDMLHEGNLVQASKKYGTKNLLHSDKDLRKSVSEIKKELKELGVDQDSQKKIEKEIKKLLARMVDTYEIDSVKIENDKAKVNLTVTGVDFDKDLNFIDSTSDMDPKTEAKIEKIVNNYEKENKSRLKREPDVCFEELLALIMPIVLDSFDQQIDDLKAKELKYEMSLVKKDDAWKINKLDVEK